MSKKIKLFKFSFSKYIDEDYLTIHIPYSSSDKLNGVRFMSNYEVIILDIYAGSSNSFRYSLAVDRSLVHNTENDIKQAEQWYDAWQESMAIARQCKELPANGGTKNVKRL